MLFVIINLGLKGAPGIRGKLSPAVANIKSYSQELCTVLMAIGAKQLTPQHKKGSSDAKFLTNLILFFNTPFVPATFKCGL